MMDDTSWTMRVLLLLVIGLCTISAFKEGDFKVRFIFNDDKKKKLSLSWRAWIAIRPLPHQAHPKSSLSSSPNLYARSHGYSGNSGAFSSMPGCLPIASRGWLNRSSQVLMAQLALTLNERLVLQKCKDSAFCQRLRGKAEGKYEVVGSSVKISDAELTASLRSSQSEKLLALRLTQYDGVLRVHVTESDHQRAEVNSVLENV